jgi:hypothetical protein
LAARAKRILYVDWPLSSSLLHNDYESQFGASKDMEA